MLIRLECAQGRESEIEQCEHELWELERVEEL